MIDERGAGVECPCCDGLFERFEPFGERPRENALCPGCGSLERHRLVWLYLRDRLRLGMQPLRVLHLAPEECLRPLLESILGLDYVAADLRSSVADILVDICALPFASDSFGLVICNHVLEHIPDDRRAMREILRVLRPGGQALMQVPIERDRETTFEDWTVTSREERTRVFGGGSHVRIYGRDYYDRLREAGFEVTLEPYARELGQPAVRAYGLRTSHVVCMGRKRGAAPPAGLD
jgi:SAM-dependent methyltransferase